jgi:hypothetical protein
MGYSIGGFRRVSRRGQKVYTSFAASSISTAAWQLPAQHRKAAVFREQTIGAEDPGAYVGALLLREIQAVSGD